MSLHAALVSHGAGPPTLQRCCFACITPWTLQQWSEQGLQPPPGIEGHQRPVTRRSDISACARRATTISERATYAQAAARGRGTGTDAAAAASGAAAAADGPRLRFYSNSHVLQPSSTIFQAVQDRLDATATAGTTSAAASGEAAPRRRRLWDEVHTLHYSRRARMHARTHTRILHDFAAAAGSCTSVCVTPGQSGDAQAGNWQCARLFHVLVPTCAAICILEL